MVDTDAIAHALTAPHGAAMPAIVAEFGAGFAAPDGALDRAAMRALVFSDPRAPARLEAILHPLIRDAAYAAAAIATGPYVIFVVPLLIESGNWRERVARVLAIDCPEAAAGRARDGAQRLAGSTSARHHGDPGHARRSGWPRPTTWSSMTAAWTRWSRKSPRLHAQLSGIFRKNGTITNGAFVILRRLVQNHVIVVQPTFTGMSF